MENWTNGRLRATRHRVIQRLNRQRFSIVFFAQPDNHVIIAPIQQLVDDDEGAEVEEEGIRGGVEVERGGVKGRKDEGKKGEEKVDEGERENRVKEGEKVKNEIKEDAEKETKEFDGKYDENGEIENPMKGMLNGGNGKRFGDKYQACSSFEFMQFMMNRHHLSHM